MSVPAIKSSFITGEIAPNLYGHVDLARFGSATTTQRNMFVGFRGGAYSRAGTAFVGYSKQTGRAYPPRLIPFQFNINQGLALEFGHLYMRVVQNGAFVLENGVAITGITQASPAHISAAATGGNTVAPINTGVVISYAPGELVTLAGGIFTVAAVVRIVDTKLLGVQPDANGTGYAPADTINLAGGTQTSPAVVTVTTTQVNAATIVNPGAGGAPGPATVTGTTGTGTKFQAAVTISPGGIIASIDSITVQGSYTVNPTTPAVEPVTGGGLAGATLALAMGPDTTALTSPGVFTANPPGGVFTQASTSGVGTGATFSFGLMGGNSTTFSVAGTYTTFPGNPVQQASTTGSGQGIQFNVTTAAVVPYANNDWVELSGISGMTQLNGQTVVVQNASPTGFDIYDVFGAPIDTTGFPPYISGGLAARIYTKVMPYAEQDLKWLKFTQSADVMSLCCVNQDTLTEYIPQDLERNSYTDWTLAPVIPAATIQPPASIAVQFSGTGSSAISYYQYVVTAINPDDGTESIAGPIGQSGPDLNIALNQGTLFISWPQVAGVQQYNIYKATPGYGFVPPAGTLFGFMTIGYGTQAIDNNITADFARVPPLHRDPFARGQIKAVVPVAGGSGYGTVTSVSITSATGSGAIVVPIVQSGAVVGYIVQSSGRNYLPGDTVVITGAHSVIATATLQVGPQTGTYPSVPAYFQQRRAYGSSLNDPDTYWMSQPGAFHNFDVRIPAIDSDAITGTPWSQQVNGIQFMVPMPGGLVVLTGSSAWQLTGNGGSSLNPQAITPGSQSAQPQAYNGCNATVPPIKIEDHILYVQAKGSIYRDLAYTYLQNIYTGADLTQNSSQLFTGFTTIEHAWTEEPNKTVWSVRDDGILRSLTYLPAEKVAGWARHDTYGRYKTVCSLTEPPVDTLYLGSERVLGGKTSYMIERQNSRIWPTVEDSWCVDIGLQLDQPRPSATIVSDSTYGIGEITGVTALVGGTNYSAATTATVVDDNGDGPGTGAVPTLLIIAGVIAGVTFAPGSRGTKYVNPRIDFYDPTGAGSGASARATLNTNATFTASAAIFSGASVGLIIRAGGGVAEIVQFLTATTVIARITTPITDLVPNSPTENQPAPQLSGTWTMTRPTTTVSGGSHLAGATVTGLADGKVIPPFVMPASGVSPLPFPASAVVIGLGYQCQLQTTYLNEGEPTMQGARKKIAAVTTRVEASRGIKIGQNMPDGAALSPMQIAPIWEGMEDEPDLSTAPYNSDLVPLYTGDIRIPVQGGWDTKGQIAYQQDQPLPMALLAAIPSWLGGDTPEIKASQRQQGRGKGGG